MVFSPINSPVKRDQCPADLTSFLNSNFLGVYNVCSLTSFSDMCGDYNNKIIMQVLQHKTLANTLNMSLK